MENESPIQQVTAARDLAALQASEILGLHAVDLMTAAAVKLGLYEGGDDTRDLADARILIHVLAGFVAPVASLSHASSLQDCRQRRTSSRSG